MTTIVNGSGAVTAGYYYDAFGVQLDVSGNVSNPYRYSGYVYDSETNLYYLNARFYSAETARFLQEDSYRGNIGDPLSLNLYAYVNYNPLIYRDPTGHWQTGDEQLPQNAQDKITFYTNIYFSNYNIYYSPSSTETQKRNAKLLMDAAHATAEAVRAEYANQSSSSNVTSTGQSATDSINNSSDGYLYPDTWKESQSGTNVNNGSTNSSKDTNNVSNDDEPIHKSNTINVAASAKISDINTDYGAAIWLQYANAAGGFGHTSLLIQDSKDVWSLFYFGAANVSQYKSKPWLAPINVNSYVDFYEVGKSTEELKDLESVIKFLRESVTDKVLNPSDGLTGMIYFNGNFIASLEEANRIYSENDDYNLLYNNCMQVCTDILSLGEFDEYNFSYQTALGRAHAEIIPNNAYMAMKNFNEYIDDYKNASWWQKLFNLVPDPYYFFNQ